jgi:CRP/FNR family transcriptional regulator, anaerobic regulatory protein
MLTRCFGFLEARVFALLSMSAEERYKFLFTQNAELFQQVLLKYLASMMGITPESLSRIRKKV